MVPLCYAFAVCERICRGRDPNATFSFSTSEVPLTTIFTQHGSPTFLDSEGRPHTTLDIPLPTIAVMNRTPQTYIQILNHEGHPNVKIPQTGQTPLHVFGLTSGAEIDQNHTVRLPPKSESPGQLCP